MFLYRFYLVFRLPPFFAPVLAGQAREAPYGLEVVSFLFEMVFRVNPRPKDSYTAR